MPAEQPPTPESNDSEPIDVPSSEASPDATTEPEDSDLEAAETAVSEGEFAEAQTSPESISEVTPTPTAQSQTLQTLQALWRSAQPPLRTGTVRLLKTTIQLLEGAVARLEETPEGSDTTATPSATAQPALPPIALPDWTNDLTNTLQRGWQRFWVWWNRILPKLRGVLPASVNEALSDRALTGAIAGVLVLVLWVGSSIVSSKPPKQVAVVPPSKSAPAKPTPIQEKKEPKPKNMPEVKVIPPPKPSPKPEPSKPTAEAPKPSPTPVIEPFPAASPSPLPSPAPTPKPSPPPLKLTPEQTLIARIQDQVAEVSDRYVNGLIQSVQANFRSSRLTVKVGDGWYSLLPPQQDNLANDVLQRAQQLNFIKLEITDNQGVLLARSPVVGAEMIVLKRSLASS